MELKPPTQIQDGTSQMMNIRAVCLPCYRVEDFSMLGPPDVLASDRYQEQPQVILQQLESVLRPTPHEEESLDLMSPPRTPQMLSPVSYLEGEIPLESSASDLSVPAEIVVMQCFLFVYFEFSTCSYQFSMKLLIILVAC